jgi:hypothetical protein
VDHRRPAQLTKTPRSTDKNAPRADRHGGDDGVGAGRVLAFWPRASMSPSGVENRCACCKAKNQAIQLVGPARATVGGEPATDADLFTTDKWRELMAGDRVRRQHTRQRSLDGSSGGGGVTAGSAAGARMPLEDRWRQGEVPSGGASSAAENGARGISSAIARVWAPRWDVEYELGLDVEALLALQQVLRVRVEITGWQKCRVVGKSQPVLMMINAVIFTRTRTLCAWASARCDNL